MIFDSYIILYFYLCLIKLLKINTLLKINEKYKNRFNSYLNTSLIFYEILNIILNINYTNIIIISYLKLSNYFINSFIY